MVSVHRLKHQAGRHNILPRTVQEFPKISLRSLSVLCPPRIVPRPSKERLRTLVIAVINIGRQDDMW